jgi:hypothetical protein
MKKTQDASIKVRIELFGHKGGSAQVHDFIDEIVNQVGKQDWIKKLKQSIDAIVMEFPAADLRNPITGEKNVSMISITSNSKKMLESIAGAVESNKALQNHIKENGEKVEYSYDLSIFYFSERE